MIQIIGAGPVGIVSGILAHLQGEEFQIFEKKNRDTWSFHDPKKMLGITLSGRGISVLERAGIDLSNSPHVQPIVGRAIHLPDGRRETMDYAPDGNPRLFSIARQNLMPLLREELMRITGNDIQFDHELRDFDTDRGISRFRTSGTDSLKSCPMGRMIACDGWGSMVRKKLCETGVAQTKTRDSGWEFVTFAAPRQARDQGSLERIHIIPRFDYFVVAIPHSDHTFSFTVGFPDIHAREQKLALLKAANHEIQACRELASAEDSELGEAGLEALLTGIQKFQTRYSIIRPGRHRVLLAGDAKHQVIHLLGQGLNLGLSDVEQILRPQDNSRPLAKRIARTDSNMRILAMTAERQLALMSGELTSEYRRTLYACRQRLHSLFPRVFRNEYDALTGDEPSLRKIQLLIKCQRIAEALFGLPVAVSVVQLLRRCKLYQKPKSANRSVGGYVAP